MKLAIEEAVLRQALEALCYMWNEDEIHPDTKERITALRTALETAEKVEPVRLQCITCGTIYQDGVPPMTNPAPAVPEVESLRQQIDLIKADLMIANEAAKESWDQAKALEQQLAECERERDEWKTGAIKRDNARHDAIEQLAACKKERDALSGGYDEVRDELAEAERILVDMRKRLAAVTKERDELVAAIETTLDENGHLADGDNCTLIALKRALAKLGADKMGERDDLL